MPILTKPQIEERLKEIVPSKKLIITPILSEKQLDSSGIDLRLSNQFIVFKSENLAFFDIGSNKRSKNHFAGEPKKKEEDIHKQKELNEKKIRKFQHHQVIPFFNYFILPPKNLVLASTLEYLSIPENLFGTLEGRSSWARLGLIIATACAIDPGYKGCITLELSNLSNIPLYLYPGIRIAKLILSDTSSDVPYDIENKKYSYQIGPEFSKAHEDPELDILIGDDD